MRFSRRLGQNAGVIALAAALLATAVAEGLYRSNVATRIEYLYTDMWHRLAGPRAAPRHTALVMLDDPTLNERPDEPLAFWTPHFARAVATLREVGVKVIAIDFIFSGSPERWIEKMGLLGREASRNYDQPFRAQINRGGVLLAAFKVGAGDTVDDFVLPSPDYLLALPDLDLAGHVGLANLPSDADGAVRRFSLIEAPGEFAQKQGMPYLAFGALAASVATGQDRQSGVWQFRRARARPRARDSDCLCRPAGKFQGDVLSQTAGAECRERPGGARPGRQGGGDRRRLCQHERPASDALFDQHRRRQHPDGRPRDTGECDRDPARRAVHRRGAGRGAPAGVRCGAGRPGLSGPAAFGAALGDSGGSGDAVVGPGRLFVVQAEPAVSAWRTCRPACWWC